jgi:hypothetical protein
MTLNQLQKDLLIGSLLGDGNMQTYSKGNTWRYRAIHGSKHVDYILYKYKILKDLCGSMPKESFTFDFRTNKVYSRYSFNTLTNPSLRLFANMFYKFDNKTQKWVKIIPIKIGLFLTPCALAFFYMDDGLLKWKGHTKAARLCTDNFAYEDVKRLQSVLMSKYKISTTLSKSRKGHRIEINQQNALLFYEMIKPYMHSSMTYKIPV